METILVVDDADDIRTAVRKMLEAKGYTVLDPQARIPKPFTPDALVAKVRQLLLAQPSPFALPCAWGGGGTVARWAPEDYAVLASGRICGPSGARALKYTPAPTAMARLCGHQASPRSEDHGCPDGGVSKEVRVAGPESRREE